MLLAHYRWGRPAVSRVPYRITWGLFLHSGSSFGSEAGGAAPEVPGVEEGGGLAPLTALHVGR